MHSRFAAFYFFLISFTPLSFATTSFSISVEEFVEASQSQKVILIDARPQKFYKEGHIENAISLPFTQTFTQFGKTGRVIGIPEAQKLFSNAGIQPDALVVAYDNHPASLMASRVLWTLLTYGHQNIKLLDGGLNAAERAGIELTQVEHKITPSNFVPSFNPQTYASRKTAIEASSNLQDFALIDAREIEHYQGEKSQAKRFGHIPNSINIDFRLNMQTDGTLKSRAELQTLYQDIPKDKQVVIYCHMGDASALEYFILRELGYQVASYDASWQEWGNDFSLPIIKPASEK